MQREKELKDVQEQDEDDEDHLQQQQQEYAFTSPARERYAKQCVPLHKAALRGEWKAAQPLLRRDSSLIKAELTEGREIALHIAAVEGHAPFVRNLLNDMDESDLHILNKKGCTALTFAAAGGHVDIAKIMVTKSPSLPKIRGPGGVTPLYMAALIGKNDVADYLFSLPEPDQFECGTQDDLFQLLIASIDSGLYGLAMSIVSKNRKLAATVDSNGDTPLTVLARSPSAFTEHRRRQGGVFQSIASASKALMKLIMRRDEAKNLSEAATPNNAYALFDCLWNSMICGLQDIESTGKLYDENTSSLVFIAAELGNYEFLMELIDKDPAFLYKMNWANHSIFHLAVLHRHVDIFNLIYEVPGTKDLMATFIDQPDGNNILHLAAKLAPPHKLTQIPGAGLQMQHEVRWYKAVEELVQPSYRNMKNYAGQTPHDLFLAEHGGLMKEGEKQMKQIAKSCMLVAMLITTVVFTTAFTVPGGYNNETGLPTLGKKRMFRLFPILEAAATLSSLMAMFMFLSIMTSRYAEEDFLTTLPMWMVSGVVALFVSIVAMMGTFCVSLLLYENGAVPVMVLLGLFGCVPLMFITVKYHLLVGVVRHTYGSRRLFGSRNRLFNSPNNYYSS